MGRYDWQEKQQRRLAARNQSDIGKKTGSAKTASFAVLGGVGVIALASALLIPDRAPISPAAPRALAAQTATPQRSKVSYGVSRDAQPIEKNMIVEPSAAAIKFEKCGSVRVTCVVDGDTIWLEGQKIRLADIDTPEVGEPRCESELVLGNKATQRLIALLNEGPFEVRTSGDREVDGYGRELLVISRNGHSLGDQLVAEGLARPWTGSRQPWC